MQRQHLEGRDLGKHGLGRRHADLRASTRVQDAIGLTGHGRVDHVGHDDHPSTVLTGMAHGLEGIDGLA